LVLAIKLKLLHIGIITEYNSSNHSGQVFGDSFVSLAEKFKKFSK